MALIVTIFACASGLELLVWLPLFWGWRQPLGKGLLVAVAFLTAALVVRVQQPWAVVTTVLSLYRLVNLRRLIVGRIQADYLYQASLRSALWLIGLQGLVLAIAALNQAHHFSALAWLYGLALAQLAFALVLWLSSYRGMRATLPVRSGQPYADHELPPLTVALPARNETDDLEACLQSLTASNYPKLEIIVLDDCSQNKRTPEIIRSFAHQGVRFIAGRVPPEHWLAKNYAYQQLMDEANGQLLLFCGVDTRFEPGSLRAMVETLLQTKSTMISLLPRNQRPAGLWPLLIQPSRYAWELALPRRRSRPPVLSTCWLITAQALHLAGGFKAVSRGHSPESYFARAAREQHDSYRFLRSTAELALTSNKSFAEQRATAVRTRYPQLHRRPELVGLSSLVELAMLVLPFGLAIGSLLERVWPLAILSLGSCLLLTVTYANIVSLTYRRFVLASLWLFPLGVLYDIGLLNYSMWQYEFDEVIWKGRNICLPVMHALPAAGRITPD